MREVAQTKPKTQWKLLSNYLGYRRKHTTSNLSQTTPGSRCNLTAPRQNKNASDKKKHKSGKHTKERKVLNTRLMTAAMNHTIRGP